MVKVTIVKQYRNTETLKTMKLSEVVRMIQSCDYAQEVEAVRELFVFTEFKRKEDGSVEGANNFTGKVPRICFSA